MNFKVMYKSDVFSNVTCLSVQRLCKYLTEINIPRLSNINVTESANHIYSRMCVDEDRCV